MDGLTLWHVYDLVKKKFPNLNWSVLNDRSVKAAIPIDLSLEERFEITIIESICSEAYGLDYALELYIDLRAEKLEYNAIPSLLIPCESFQVIQIRSFEGSEEEVTKYLQNWLESMHCTLSFSI
jgi:hypothetical protein